MEVILKKYHKGLGEKNDIVTVKPGYGRNYLIPQGIAVLANETNLKVRANHIKFKDKYEASIIAEYENIAGILKEKSVNVGAKVGTTDKIFGKITTHQLAAAMLDQLGIEVDRRKITLPTEEIKTLGEYAANLDLHEKVQATLQFKVVAE